MDAPTQGHPSSPAQMSADIDKKLNELAQMPPERRVMARATIERAIGKKGTPAQQARYAELMKDVPSSRAMTRLRSSQMPGTTNAKLLLPSQTQP